MQRAPTDAAWAADLTATLPVKWQKHLRERHKETGSQGTDWPAMQAAQVVANIELRKSVERCTIDVRLGLNASDADICDAADVLARKVSELAPIYKDDAAPVIGLSMLRCALGRYAMGQGAEPPNAVPDSAGYVDDGPAVARMADPLWWRRQLRKVHAKQVEGAAIALGYVNKRQEPYVSNESVYRRAQQNERNALALENTTATNEDGQEFTLAELAATGPADKAIRRAELMTRIAGFERESLKLGHVGMFLTVTCPSRMHRWRTRPDGSVQENKKYDGTLPNAAQAYLATVWARIRSQLDKRGIEIYGFRIAEPQHDGTPHWHLLVFLGPAYQGDVKRGAVPRFNAIVRRYALGKGEAKKPIFGWISPYRNQKTAKAAQDHLWRVAERKRQNSERGAKKHRVDFKSIDYGKGSAAGYIAKYVSKNIDGHRLDKDLIGNDAVETSHRVEAWASTWGIRQFQQIGGPPVGVWRELRRIPELPDGCPQHLIDAHHAVNKITDMEAGTVKSVAWEHYVKAQGGPLCGRDCRIKMAMTEVPDGDTSSRYGEAAAARPLGVETSELQFYTPAHMAHTGGKAERVVVWVVESTRHVWTVAKAAVRFVLDRFSETGATSRPWTRVNNCTDRYADADEKSPPSALAALRAHSDCPPAVFEAHFVQGPS